MGKDKKEKKKKKGSTLLIIIFLIIIVFGTYFGYRVYENGGGLQGLLMAVFSQNPKTLKNLDTMYVLVLGVSEDLGTTITDTIMICAYNPKDQTASMLSIPRDTFIGKDKNASKGSDKINALYTVSPEKIMNKVSDITGLSIDYYAVVNTQALVNIVDIIGGVEFDVPIDMKYDDNTQNLHINLKKGLQKIDGKKAEQLLRFRHNNNGTTYPWEYGDNDYGRMRTQREFIVETMKQTIQFKNIPKLGSLTREVFDNIETNLKLDQILDYLPYIVNLNPDTIDSQQLPGVSEKCNEIWFFIHNKKETETLVQEMTDRIENIMVIEEDTESDTNTNTNSKTNINTETNSNTNNKPNTNTRS